MAETHKSKNKARGLRSTITVLKRKVAELESWPLIEGYRAALAGQPDRPQASADWREGWQRGRNRRGQRQGNRGGGSGKGGARRGGSVHDYGAKP